MSVTERAAGLQASSRVRRPAARESQRKQSVHRHRHIGRCLGRVSARRRPPSHRYSTWREKGGWEEKLSGRAHTAQLSAASGRAAPPSHAAMLPVAALTCCLCTCRRRGCPWRCPARTGTRQRQPRINTLQLLPFQQQAQAPLSRAGGRDSLPPACSQSGSTRKACGRLLKQQHRVPVKTEHNTTMNTKRHAP